MKNRVFTEASIDPDPFTQFDKWFREHKSTGIAVPDSVFLGTASSDCKVSVRTVLLKGFDKTGFVFFTNYNSKKGNQLFANPNAALLFYWSESARQVRIEGITETVSVKDSESYFRTRPRESQISAWASEQSSVIPDRDYLEKRYDYFEARFFDNPVEKPLNWGGFRLIPEWFEFWQEGDFRMHDRLSYRKIINSWVIERLAP